MAKLSLIIPELQKTAEGKKRKPKIAAGFVLSNATHLFFHQIPRADKRKA